MDPEKILDGLNSCIKNKGCLSCPYENDGCGSKLRREVREYLYSVGENEMAKGFYLASARLYNDAIAVITASLSKTTIDPAELESLM